MARQDKASEIMELFLRAVNAYNSIGKRPMGYGTLHRFYHSERHLIDAFAAHPEMNVTELAAHSGVTKGAISQHISRLEQKGAVRRVKSGGNEKEIFIELTALGKRIFEAHREVNDRSLSALRKMLRDVPETRADFAADMLLWICSHLEGGAAKGPQAGG